MSQRDLAVALGREHGMVARIELGERRVDFAEAYHLFMALGTNPNIEADSLMTKFAESVVIFPHQQEDAPMIGPRTGTRHLTLRHRSNR